jgi:hypothetical protein
MKTVILGDVDGDVQEQWEKVAQGNTESVDTYWSRFQAAFRACLATPQFSADEDRKIRLFKRGLQPRFRQHLSTCSYTTAAELKKLACAYEREAPTPRVAASLTNVELQHSGAGSETSAQDPEIAAFACLHPDTRDAICDQAETMRIAPLRLFAILGAKSGVCHTCGQAGHWKNECPDTHMPSTHRQQGHKKRPAPRQPGAEGRDVCPRHPHGTHSGRDCTQRCPKHPDRSHKASECPDKDDRLVQRTTRPVSEPSVVVTIPDTRANRAQRPTQPEHRSGGHNDTIRNQRRRF